MRLVALMLSLFMFGCAADSKREAPVAVDGVMDLSDWDFERDGPVELRGEWLFAHGELVEAESLESLQSRFDDRIDLPNTWNKHFAETKGLDPSETQFGVASYALIVSGLQDASLLVSSGRAQSAGSVQILEVDGARIAGPVLSGEPGPTLTESRPTHYRVIRFGEFRPSGDETYVVLLHTSNFMHHRSGVWAPPSLGTAISLRPPVWRAVILSGFVAGVFVILACYHLLIYYTRRDDRAAFWFALVFLVAAAREVVTAGFGELLLDQPSRELTEHLYRVEYMTMSLFIAYGFFLNALLPLHWAYRAYQVLALTLIPAFLVCLLEVEVFTGFLWCWHIYLFLFVLICIAHVLSSIKLELPYAKPMLGAILLAAVGVAHDVVATNMDSGFYIMPYTSIATVLIQGLIIAKKFSNAMDERDAKNQELLSTYQQLDDELLKRENLESSNQALARENEIAAQQLIQADKLATMGTMVAGVAHDIANPTGLIQGSTVLMEETRDTLRTTVLALFEGDSSPESLKLQNDLNGLFDDLDRSARDVMLGADRIKAINSAIRNQARSDQGHSSVILRELIDECLTVVSHRLKGIGMDVRVPEDFKVELIRSQFGQVLMNLLSNAADAIAESEAKANGKIRVDVEALSGGRFALSIDDNGPGVPAELRAKILEPFFTTKGVGKGTGLGMPIVLRILDNHGMKLEILDAPELGGARFRMSPVEA